MVRNPRKVLDICCEYNHYLLEANAQYKRLMDKVGPGDELDDLDLKITALCDARNEWYWYMEQVYARVQKKMAELETSTAQFRNKFCTTFIMSHNEFDKRIREYQTDDDFDAMLLMYRTGQVNDQSHPGASDMCKSYLKFREEKITLDKLKAACAIYSKLKEDIDERGNPTFACLKAYKNVSVIDASIFAPWWTFHVMSSTACAP